MLVNARFFDTSTAYESTPTLSAFAVQLTTIPIAVVSCPSAGCDCVTRFTIVSVTNPRVSEYGPPFPRSSIARTRQKYVSLYNPVAVSLVHVPSTVSVNVMLVNARFFDTSTAYESTPTLSVTTLQLTTIPITVVSCPSAGCDSAT